MCAKIEQFAIERHFWRGRSFSCLAHFLSEILLHLFCRLKNSELSDFENSLLLIVYIISCTWTNQLVFSFKLLGHLKADYTAWALLIVEDHRMTYSCWILCCLSHLYGSTDNMSVAILKVKLHAPVTRYVRNPYIFPQNGSWSRNSNLQVLT